MAFALGAAVGAHLARELMKGLENRGLLPRLPRVDLEPTKPANGRWWRP